MDKDAGSGLWKEALARYRTRAVSMGLHNESQRGARTELMKEV